MYSTQIGFPHYQGSSLLYTIDQSVVRQYLEIVDALMLSNIVQLKNSFTWGQIICLPIPRLSQLLPSAPLVCLCSYGAYIASNMDPDQTGLIRLHIVCVHEKI